MKVRYSFPSLFLTGLGKVLLLSLLRESPPYPEFIQGKASGKNLSLSMESILKNDKIGLEFEAISKKLVKMLKAREQEAVDWILQETMLG